MAPPAEKTLATLRVPRTLLDEVRHIAAREGETQSMILRRLLRLGLTRERERRDDNEAA